MTRRASRPSGHWRWRCRGRLWAFKSWCGIRTAWSFSRKRMPSSSPMLISMSKTLAKAGKASAEMTGRSAVASIWPCLMSTRSANCCRCGSSGSAKSPCRMAETVARRLRETARFAALGSRRSHCRRCHRVVDSGGGVRPGGHRRLAHVQYRLLRHALVASCATGVRRRSTGIASTPRPRQRRDERSGPVPQMGMHDLRLHLR